MENKKAKPEYKLLKSFLKDQVNDLEVSTLKQRLSDVPNRKPPKDLLKKRKKVEETHTSRTYFVRNDLVKRMDQKKAEIGNGFITRFINYAIENALDEIDKFDEHKGNSNFPR